MYEYPNANNIERVEEIIWELTILKKLMVYIKFIYLIC
jgi:hypothetical protein